MATSDDAMMAEIKAYMAASSKEKDKRKRKPSSSPYLQDQLKALPSEYRDSNEDMSFDYLKQMERKKARILKAALAKRKPEGGDSDLLLNHYAAQPRRPALPSATAAALQSKFVVEPFSDSYSKVAQFVQLDQVLRGNKHSYSTYDEQFNQEGLGQGQQGQGAGRGLSMGAGVGLQASKSTGALPLPSALESKERTERAERAERTEGTEGIERATPPRARQEHASPSPSPSPSPHAEEKKGRGAGAEAGAAGAAGAGTWAPKAPKAPSYPSRLHRKYPRLCHGLVWTDADLNTALSTHQRPSDGWLTRFMEQCYDEAFSVCNTPVCLERYVLYIIYYILYTTYYILYTTYYILHTSHLTPPPPLPGAGGCVTAWTWAVCRASLLWWHGSCRCATAYWRCENRP
jgi:hypothetical protein